MSAACPGHVNTNGPDGLNACPTCHPMTTAAMTLMPPEFAVPRVGWWCTCGCTVMASGADSRSVGGIDRTAPKCPLCRQHDRTATMQRGTITIGDSR